MINALWIIGLIVAALVGVLLSIVQLPGVWLTLAAATLFDWHHHWARIGWRWLVGLAALAAVGEILDLAATAIMARRAGASRRASIGALLGGFIGMLFLTGLVPIPVVGTVIGGFVGCFAGAVLGEISVHDDLERGTRVGLAATIGRLAGLLTKMAVSMVVAGVAVGMAIR